MLPQLTIPQPRPVQRVPGYAMRDDQASLLDWEFVVRQMTLSRFYWLSTASVRGEPHDAPVWGLWLADRLHFEGAPQTKWARNLRANPRVSVHLPDGERVVIIEGVARALEDDELTDDEWTALDSSFQHKYAVAQGSPFRYVEPAKVMAWHGEDLHNMTRWIFDQRPPEALTDG